MVKALPVRTPPSRIAADRPEATAFIAPQLTARVKVWFPRNRSFRFIETAAGRHAGGNGCRQTGEIGRRCFPAAHSGSTFSFEALLQKTSPI
jgi:hypothetical protein